MKRTHLLDTNILSHIMREPQGSSARRILQLGDDAVCTSIVVASEIRYGCRKSGSKRLAERAEAILDSMAVLPLASPVDIHYGAIRAHLEKRGKLIGPNDLLIAAHARSLSLTLVTDNEAEFRRVPQLRVENWLSQQTRAPKRPKGSA